ncbi:hypothetical protein BDR07DRAFT_1494491 [Suillus spraguei]|nr:hypothetical protein BDR07DRAFT_1494491 [Suillus spraguei]
MDTKPIVCNVEKSKGKKCECSMDDTGDSELTNKHQKVSLAPSLPEHDPGSPINISDLDVSLLSTDHSFQVTQNDTASTVVHSSPHGTSNADFPLPLSNHDCNHSSLGSLSNSSDNQHEPDLPLPALPPSSPPHHGALLPSGIPLDNSKKENVPFVLKNTLANIFGGPNGIPEHIPTPALPPSTGPSEGEPIKSGLTTGGIDVKKSSKMRPGSTKNGRNLCALRWLKQTSKNRTMDEFKLYWNALATAQQDEYQAEAECLDSTGTWKKVSDSAVINGALH